MSNHDYSSAESRKLQLQALTRFAICAILETGGFTMADISSDNAQYLDDAIKRGTYTDESEALNEAVKLLRKRDQLRVDVGAGINQANQGELLPADEVFERLEERARQIEELAQKEK